MLSYFTRASQRVQLGDVLKTGRACTFNYVRTTGNVAGWDADKYSPVASVALKHAASLLDLLNAQPGFCLQQCRTLHLQCCFVDIGERIMDLGCGSGEVTMALKDAGSEVVAIDASPAMVEAAKAKGARNAVLHV